MSAPGSIRAMKSLIQWSQRDEWADTFSEWLEGFIEHACELLDTDPTTFAEEINPDFFEYFTAFAVEAFLASAHGDEGRNPIDDYLKRRGFKEKPAAKRFLQALRSSRLSIYEVVDVAPGKSVLVRDLLRGGEPIMLEDESGSEAAGLWDRLAMRVLRVGNRNFMPGGVLPLQFDSVDRIRRHFADARERASGQGRNVSLDELIEAEPQLFTSHWLDELDGEGALYPNEFEDESDVPAFQFPIVGAQTEAIETLDRRPEFRRRDDGPPAWTWSLHAPAAEDRPSDEEEPEFLGAVGISEGALLLQPLDNDAAERGTALVAGALGALVGEAVMVEGSDESDLESELEEILGDRFDLDAPLDRDAVLRAVLEHSLDRKTPMLDGLSPREAAADPANVEKVVNLLKFLENADWHMTEDVDAPRHDFRWVWEELGIADKRQ